MKLVELEEDYDLLHFYFKLAHEGRELEFCIQFADLLAAAKYYNYHQYKYISDMLDTDEFWGDCDAALLERLQEEGMELEHLLAPLLDHEDILVIWENTTGRILGQDAGRRKVKKEEWMEKSHRTFKKGCSKSYGGLQPAVGDRN